MGNALNSLGLNGGGAWRSGRVGLVQCQSWITPEDRWESQPLLLNNPSGGLVSVSRLADRAALAQTLGLDPSEAQCAADSMLLRHSLDRWGDDCFRHLTGEYTFAIWNDHDHSLRIETSPMSSQPLFYYDSPTHFAFASMPKGLFALAGVPRVLDEEYVAKYLARVPRPPETTFYRGIKRVLPGQTVTLRQGQVVVRNISGWDEGRVVRFSSDTEYEEAFLDLYSRVVRDHVSASGQVGVMLSGGLDSSSLAALAAPILGAKNQHLSAYTEAPHAGFSLPSSSERIADETERVRAIAAWHKTLDVRFVRSNGSHFLQNIAAYFHHAEVPFRNACNRPWIENILGLAQSQGTQVLLMGNQGNATVSWKGSKAKESNATSLLRQAASRIKGYAASKLTTPFARVLRMEQARKYASQSPVRSNPASSDQRYEQLRRMTAHSSNLWTGYLSLFGVEVRDPTADDRIVRFCLALPPDQFCRGDVSRRLIRQAMVGRLPPEILSVQRRGLQAADWFWTLAAAQDDLRSELDRIAECALADHLIDIPHLRRSLARLASAGREGSASNMELRNTLEHGLMTGRFLSWFETGE